MGLVVSLILGSLGIFFLIRGKKTMNPGMMIAGGTLIILSYFLPGGSSPKIKPAPARGSLEIVTPTPFSE